jgi:hypothetical protein
MHTLLDLLQDRNHPAQLVIGACGKTLQIRVWNAITSAYELVTPQFNHPQKVACMVTMHDDIQHVDHDVLLDWVVAELAKDPVRYFG